jgi:protein-S-isoprenylcysteine O-methyltransferase Ste14
MGLVTYTSLAFIVLLVSFVVFRVVVRRDYQRRGELSPISVFMEYLAIGSFGSILFYGGLSLTVLIILSLGIRRSHGREVTRLRQSGVYRLSRNPQALAFVVAIIGNLVLWPTWKNLLSLVLLVVLLHLMIRTEEEHLRRVFGEEYEQYRQRVPRFLGLPGGAR